MNEKILDMIIADLKDVKSDVKSLLQFKWQIVGGSIVMSLLVTIGFQVLSLWLKN